MSKQLSHRFDFGTSVDFGLLSAAAYSALGFLPSVVMLSVRNDRVTTTWLAVLAFCLSLFATVAHFYTAISGGNAPSGLGLQVLSFGSLALAAGVLIFSANEARAARAAWIAALMVFAVSAFHLSAGAEANSWFVELVAHQSSLPIALIILYQNYRFAFADLFLKRALSLMLLSLVAFSLYVGVAAPLLRYHETHDRNDAQAIAIILTLWIATAIIYPSLHNLAVWIVDRIILRRADYARLQIEIATRIESLDKENDVLGHVGATLARVLTADSCRWKKIETSSPTAIVSQNSLSALVRVPTGEPPNHAFQFEKFRGGRRLLSDETAMLETIALITARRIDALRVVHERCERQFRDQEFSRLAAEAQLMAIRAQINPHFLFNALTTIGYLIQAAPEKAFQTLLHLTRLLRSVLTSTAEFWTLGEELKLVRDYLDIERARFEERLEVEVNVPIELEKIRIPSLLLQPLVENAIKHAIARNKAGGKIIITASRDKLRDGRLRMEVIDSGGSYSNAEENGRAGTGLKNARARLAAHFGDSAELLLTKKKRGGTKAIVKIPVRETAKENEAASVNA
ncbi:MAG: histidine kinase [Acidobacteria bacterium]|nr:histidine kinase [Acidobacteriota bacterium]